RHLCRGPGGRAVRDQLRGWWPPRTKNFADASQPSHSGLRLAGSWISLLSSEVKHQSRRTAAGDADHHVLVRGPLLLVEDGVTVVHISLDDLRLASPAYTLPTRGKHADPCL